MRAIFLLARFFPYWGIPIGWILIEQGIRFRRMKQKSRFFFFVIGGIYILLSILWFVFRGDKFSDRWVRELFFD